jgi:hypothetical protein
MHRWIEETAASHQHPLPDRWPPLAANDMDIRRIDARGAAR